MHSAPRLCSLPHPVFTLYCTTGKHCTTPQEQFHFYAADTQLYISFSTNNDLQLANTVDKIKECSTDLDKWFSQNKLNFKKDKTELLYMYSKYNPQQCLPPLRFGTDTIQPAQSARDIGVILDSTIMTMLPHVDYLMSEQIQFSQLNPPETLA